MPVTHGVAGSSPVRTAFKERKMKLCNLGYRAFSFSLRIKNDDSPIKRHVYKTLAKAGEEDDNLFCGRLQRCCKRKCDNLNVLIENPGL